MKRRMKAGKKAKAMDMAKAAPFVKKAKKPEADDKPIKPVGAPSVNRNVPSKRAKRLAGVLL